uniref:Keratin n=1 Tax=Gopherus agassizii TaxID=38772 RepID=A0A452HBY0_9SAUR
MSCSSLCYPECGVTHPSPVSGSCNEPCVRQCPDSEVLIQPSPVVVTIPGPILSSFPQHSEVGAAGAPVVGPGLYGFGGRSGYGGLSGYGGGYGGLCVLPCIICIAKSLFLLTLTQIFTLTM